MTTDRQMMLADTINAISYVRALHHRDYAAVDALLSDDIEDRMVLITAMGQLTMTALMAMAAERADHPSLDVLLDRIQAGLVLDGISDPEQ